MTTTSLSSENELAISTNEINFDVEKRIESLITGSLPYYDSILKDLFRANRQNAEMLCEFVITEINNQNIRTSTKLTHIKIICWFSRYLDYRNFQVITRDDIIGYLNSLRKSESLDPSHKWIGTYNTRQMILSKFFRWFYNKNFLLCQKMVLRLSSISNDTNQSNKVRN